MVVSCSATLHACSSTLQCSLRNSLSNRTLDHERILFGRQRRRAFLNEGIKLVQINRFDEVMPESRCMTFADTIFHSVTGQSDSEKRRLGVQLFHQINSAAVGQTKIANEHIKFFLRT